jgi:hypothetical protein
MRLWQSRVADLERAPQNLMWVTSKVLGSSWRDRGIALARSAGERLDAAWFRYDRWGRSAAPAAMRPAKQEAPTSAFLMIWSPCSR